MWWKLDFIWQPVMISSMVGQKRSSKALPKAKLGAKNGHNRCLVICCPSAPRQLSKSQWNYYIWEVCSANQWDVLKAAMPAPGTGQQKRPSSSPQQKIPDRTSHNQCFKSWKNLVPILPVLSHPPSSPDISLTNYYFFKHLNNLLQRKHFHSQKDTENALCVFM